MYAGARARSPTSRHTPALALVHRGARCAPYDAQRHALQKMRASKWALPSGKPWNPGFSALFPYQSIAGQSSSACVEGMPGAGICPNEIVGLASASCWTFCARSNTTRAAFCAIH